MTGRHVEVGEMAVFAGPWLAAETAGRYRIGFTGRIAEHLLLGEVFDCTRGVAEALCAEQEHRRDQHRQLLAGLPDSEIDDTVDVICPRMAVVVDVLVYGASAAAQQIEAMPDGWYRIDLGWPW